MFPNDHLRLIDLSLDLGLARFFLVHVGAVVSDSAKIFELAFFVVVDYSGVTKRRLYSAIATVELLPCFEPAIRFVKHLDILDEHRLHELNGIIEQATQQRKLGK